MDEVPSRIHEEVCDELSTLVNRKMPLRNLIQSIGKICSKGISSEEFYYEFCVSSIFLNPQCKYDSSILCALVYLAKFHITTISNPYFFRILNSIVRKDSLRPYLESSITTHISDIIDNWTKWQKLELNVCFMIDQIFEFHAALSMFHNCMIPIVDRFLHNFRGRLGINLYKIIRNDIKFDPKYINHYMDLLAGHNISLVIYAQIENMPTGKYGNMEGKTFEEFTEAKENVETYIKNYGKTQYMLYSE